MICDPVVPTRRLFQGFYSPKPTFDQTTLHILAITETHLDPVIDSTLLSIEGYSIDRKDRNAWGGGVAFSYRVMYQ